MGKDRFEDLDFIDFNDSRQQEISEISRSLKALAGEHGDCRYAVGGISQPEMVHLVRGGVCLDRFSVSEKFPENISAYCHRTGEGRAERRGCQWCGGLSGFVLSGRQHGR